MNTQAWFAVGVVAYLVMGLIFLGVILGLSTTEQIKRYDFVMGFTVMALWFPLMIVCLSMLITDMVTHWRRVAGAGREPMDTEEGGRE